MRVHSQENVELAPEGTETGDTVIPCRGPVVTGNALNPPGGAAFVLPSFRRRYPAVLKED